LKVTVETPARMEGTYSCPECRRPTQHFVRAVVSTHDFDDSGLVQFWNHYVTVQCKGCETVSFCHESSNSEEEDFDAQGRPHLIRHQTQYPNYAPDNAPEPFVMPVRIEELDALRPSQYDLTRLIQMLVELNRAYAAHSYLSCIFLLRAVLDHVAPVFGFNTFGEVVNNYGEGGRSFRESMQHLQHSLRKIADSFLHGAIRSKETVPTKMQVEFRPAVDTLIAEIIRLLRAAGSP